MIALAYSIRLIEDDQIIGEALLDRFDLEGFECDWFQTGKAGSVSLGRKSYDVVISDIQLPDIEGGDLFARQKQEVTALPPFIFITGHGTEFELIGHQSGAPGSDTLAAMCSRASGDTSNARSGPTAAGSPTPLRCSTSAARGLGKNAQARLGRQPEIVAVALAQ